MIDYGSYKFSDYANAIKEALGACERRTDDFEDMFYYNQYDGDDNTDEVNMDIADLIPGLDWAKFGCTKAVFKLKQFDNVVFKVPYIGWREYTWHEADEETILEEQGFYKHAWDIYDPDGSNGIETGRNDYCGVEQYVYNKAVDFGVADLFAETAFLCYFLDYKIYISECVPDESHLYDSSLFKPESYEKAKTYKKNKVSLCEEGIARLIDDYGEDKTTRLLNFLRRYQIEDLHSGNLNCRDGKLIIIDYSSYHDSAW